MTCIASTNCNINSYTQNKLFFLLISNKTTDETFLSKTLIRKIRTIISFPNPFLGFFISNAQDFVFNVNLNNYREVSVRKLKNDYCEWNILILHNFYDFKTFVTGHPADYINLNPNKINE